MKTNTAPQDYNRRVVIVSQLTKLCKDCGANVYITPDGAFRCMACRKVNHYEEVQEKNAAEYRLMKAEEQKARELATAVLPQMAFVSDCLNMIADIEPETEAEMNRWIVENDEWLSIDEAQSVTYGTADLTADPRTASQIANDLDDADTMQTRKTDRPI